MRMLRSLVMLACLAAPAAAQDVRTRLQSRGLPADLVDQVTSLAAEATAQGLPATPLADKAIEGFAKNVPAPRILTALRQFNTRMMNARGAVRDAGITQPEGELIAAAADAMSRGLGPAQISRVVRAAPQPALATPGLTVAAALAAQGVPATVAADVVATAIQRGSTTSQILDLPSMARAMESRGMTPDDAGRELLRNGGRGPGDGAPGSREGGMEGRHGPDGRGSGGAPPPRPPGSGRGPGSGGPGGPGPRPPGEGGGGMERPPRP